MASVEAVTLTKVSQPSSVSEFIVLVLAFARVCVVCMYVHMRVSAEYVSQSQLAARRLFTSRREKERFERTPKIDLTFACACLRICVWYSLSLCVLC